MNSSEDKIGYNAWLRRGILLREKRHYPEAISALEQAIVARPDSAQPFLEIARCLADSERPKEALEILERGQSLDPEDSFPNSLRAWIYCNMGKPQAARDEAALALQKSPHDLFALRSLGRAWSIVRNWPKTKAAAESVLAIDPRCTYALNLLATASRGMGRLTESREIVATILRLEPENPWAHANAGFNALTQGNQPRAEGHFREALRLNPRYGYARYGLVRAIEARFFLCRWSDRVNIDPRFVRYFVSGLYFLLGLLAFAVLARHNRDLAEHLPRFGMAIISILLTFFFSVIFLFGLTRWSRRLIKLSYWFDPQLSDLLDAKSKEKARHSALAICALLIVFLISGLYLLTALTIVYVGLVVWAAWPKKQVDLMDLSLPIDGRIENSTVS